ncbi:MAG TPA: septum site-determining protein MinC [Beijerinckiaceae bacterium]
MPSAARTNRSIRFRGRSFMALVLAPEPPVAAWLEGLDALMARSPGFFSGRAIVVDVSGLPQLKADLTHLIAELNGRGVRIMGIEGADPALLGLGLPPPMTGGRNVGEIEAPEMAAGAKPARKPASDKTPAKPAAASLLLDTPVRSGQSIVFPEGDVTVVGSVSSGAEIVAGGSIHVYGTLRGRAIAGSMGDARARIYCRKLEAELLAIDGLYQTAEDMDAAFRGRAVQVRLDGDAIRMEPLG